MKGLRNYYNMFNIKMSSDCFAKSPNEAGMKIFVVNREYFLYGGEPEALFKTREAAQEYVDSEKAKEAAKERPGLSLYGYGIYELELKE